jgi:hypothetical protein
VERRRSGARRGKGVGWCPSKRRAAARRLGPGVAPSGCGAAAGPWAGGRRRGRRGVRRARGRRVAGRHGAPKRGAAREGARVLPGAGVFGPRSGRCVSGAGVFGPRSGRCVSGAGVFGPRDGRCVSGAAVRAAVEGGVAAPCAVTLRRRREQGSGRRGGSGRREQDRHRTADPAPAGRPRRPLPGRGAVRAVAMPSLPCRSGPQRRRRPRLDAACHRGKVKGVGALPAPAAPHYTLRRRKGETANATPSRPAGRRRGRLRRRAARPRRPRGRPVQPGGALAPVLGVPAQPGRAVRDGRAHRATGGGADGEPLPDPLLPGGRGGAGLAGAGRGAGRHHRGRAHAGLLLHRQGPGLRLLHRAALRPERPAEPWRG